MEWVFRKFDYRNRATSILVFIGILLTEALVGFIVYRTGGTTYVYPYFMFFPVIIGGFVFGCKIGLFFAVTGALILGPYMPLHVAYHIPQQPRNWLIRMGFLCLMGGLVGLLRSFMVDYYDRREKYLTIDPFIGLPNRNNFIQVADEKINQMNSYSLLLIEIKNQNDIVAAFGFKFFSDLIRYMASELKEILGLTNSLFSIRLDMLGFGVVYDIEPHAKKIVEFFKKPVIIQEIPIFCDVVVGISKYPNDGKTSVELIQNALLAIDEAKKMHKPIMDLSSREKRPLPVIHLISQIDAAIKAGDMDFYYQPILNTVDRKPFSVEALIRWHHPQHGLICPNEYIDYLESTNLINELTYWALDYNGQRVIDLKKSGFPVRMALNISPTNLLQEDFISQAKKILSRCCVSPNQIMFEITERGLITEYEEVLQKLNELHDLGALLSIDDFGTGNTSIDSFSRFHVDSIKIDQMFIKDINKNQTNKNIVRCLITMTKSINIKTVAEGVETQESCEEVMALGVDFLQGYYLCKPMNYKDLTSWLKQHWIET